MDEHVASPSLTKRTAAPAREPSIVPPVLQLIFFVSGASALIDQVVWTRALYRIFGVTAPAASTVLAAFMAGLALGSYAFGRWVDRGFPPLRLYAAMELLIGLMAPLTPWIFFQLQPAYVGAARAVGLESAWLPVLRAGLCLLVLLPPTILMGGTLPVLAKAYLRDHPGRVVATLYSINTWGAVAGCVAAGYLLLGVLGETRSLVLAGAGNVLAAAMAWSVARQAAPTLPPHPSAPSTDIKGGFASPGGPMTRLVLGVSFINGFAALALEVLWTRTLGIFTDTSVYAYTCIVGLFLIGIALGSQLIGPKTDQARRPLTLLGGLVALMAFFLVIAIRVFLRWMPTADIGGGTGSMVKNITTWMPLRTIGLAAIAVAPITLLSGACFPLLARLVVQRSGCEGRELGRVYSINTIGGILGAALAGFVMLPTLHDKGSYFCIAVLYLASAAACLAADRRPGTAVGVVLGLGAVIGWVLPPGGSLSAGVIARLGTVAMHEETPAGTVSAFTTADGAKRLFVNGTWMTHLCTDTKFIAHLSLALHPQPKNALTICLGMGTTFRSASRHGIDVTAVELQPAVARMFPFFHEDAGAVLRDPRHRIRVGDGRNFLLLSGGRYSSVSIDPAPPMYSAGTVNLYTREFFELCRDHLDDDGNTCLWVPLFSCVDSDFRLIVRTFRAVFPHCQLWRGPDGLGVYLVGSPRPLIVRPARLRQLGASAAIAADIAEYQPAMWRGWPSLKNFFLMGNRGVDRFVASEGRMLTDDRPYTEFPWLTWISYGGELRRHWMEPRLLADHCEPPDASVFPQD